MTVRKLSDRKIVQDYRGVEPPVCPAHHLPMLVGSSQERFRYYYCRVVGCKESQKKSRGSLQVL